MRAVGVCWCGDRRTARDTACATRWWSPACDCDEGFIPYATRSYATHRSLVRLSTTPAPPGDDPINYWIPLLSVS